MTTAKHTPGPWRVHAGHLIVGGNPQFLIADAKWDRPESPQWDANAAHIVRCVNAHDDLVAALRVAERELNISAQSQPQASIALATVRATLAKAEGKS